MSTQISFPAINEGVKNPMRWYLNPKRRNIFRKACREERLNSCLKYKLFTPSQDTLSFQVYTELIAPFTYDWQMLDENENVVFQLDEIYLKTALVGNYTYVYYMTGDAIPFLIPPGFYTMRLTITDGSSNSETWYSEEFYSLGYCSQGDEQVGDIELCSGADFQSGIGSTTYTHDATDPCSICIEADNQADVIIVFPDVLPVNAAVYSVIINASNLVNEQILVNVGDGDQFTITTNGSHQFYAYSALSNDLTITFQFVDPLSVDPPNTGCIDLVSVQMLDVQDLDLCHPSLEWWNDCGLVGEIYYGDSGYKNKLWLDEACEIVNPETKIFIEGIENGEKDLIPTFQKRSTTYSIEFGLLPNFVIESLFEMTLHKYIKYIEPDGMGESMIKNVVIKAGDGDEAGGCYRFCTMTFELDDTTIAGVCCDEIIPNLIPCYTISYNSLNPGETFDSLSVDVGPTTYALPIDVAWDEGAGAIKTALEAALDGFGVIYTSVTVEITSLGGGLYNIVINIYQSDTFINLITPSSGADQVFEESECESPSTVQYPLRLLFDDIDNVPVADAASVSDWNVFFDLPTNGTPFSSVAVVGNEVKLYGGSGITLKNNLFYTNTNIIQIIDDANCIVIINDQCFNSATELTIVSLSGVTAVGVASFASCYKLQRVYFKNCLAFGDFCFATLITPNNSLILMDFSACVSLGSTSGNNNVFSGISGNTMSLSILAATCPDLDVVYLQANNTVTLTCV